MHRRYLSVLLKVHFSSWQILLKFFFLIQIKKADTLDVCKKVFLVTQKHMNTIKTVKLHQQTISIDTAPPAKDLCGDTSS